MAYGYVLVMMFEDSI